MTSFIVSTTDVRISKPSADVFKNRKLAPITYHLSLSVFILSAKSIMIHESLVLIANATWFFSLKPCKVKVLHCERPKINSTK